MKYIVIIGLVIMIGCDSTVKESISIYSNMQSIDVPLKESQANYQFVQNANYIFLDDQFLISKIARMIFFENNIFIHDELSNSIVVFSYTGKYLYHINHIGKGPLEYLKLTDFTIDKVKKNLLIFDGKQHKLLTYSIDNKEFIKELKIDFYPISLAYKSECLYFYNPFTFLYPENREYYFSLLKTTENLKVLDKYLPIDEAMGGFRSVPSKNGFFYGKELCFLNRFDNIIYGLKQDTVYARYKIMFKNNEIFDQVLKDAIAKGRRDENFYSQCASDIMNFCENDNFITFSYIRNNKVFFAVFSKYDNKVIFHNSIVQSYVPELVKRNVPIFNFPVYVDDDFFVSVLPFRLMLNLKEDEKLHQLMEENMTDTSLKEKLLNYTLNSNPILVLYKFQR